MISVALAYYNGMNFIDEQLESILSQLGEDDEVILSVDSAEDGSEELLKAWAWRDSRIHLLEGPHQGVVKNFAHALEHCSGDIIFLSDQDDIWMEDKVKKVLRAMEQSGCSAVLHNAVLVDEHGEPTGEPSLFALRDSRPGLIKNLLKNSYVGCCMAFRRELLPVILPIPEKMYMHDYWIGTVAEKCGGVGLIREPLIDYRRHGGNVTEMKHGSLRFMLKKRVDMLRCLAVLRKRLKEKE